MYVVSFHAYLSIYVFYTLIILEWRLRGGVTNYAGRVEVRYDDGENGLVWGTVCQKNFDIEEAHMICKKLGFE